MIGIRNFYQRLSNDVINILGDENRLSRKVLSSYFRRKLKFLIFIVNIFKIEF